MGRNARKRRARKTEEKAKRKAEQAKFKALAPPDPAPIPKEPPRWLRRTVITEVHGADVAQSYAAALFRISCAVTEADNFDAVAAQIAELAEVDAVILAHLVQGPDEDRKNRGDDVNPALRDVHLVRLGEHTAVSRVSLPVKVDDEVVVPALQGEVVRIDDAPRDAVFVKAFGLGTSVGSMLALPLKYHGQVIGVLVALRREIGAFHDVGESLLNNIADSVALDLAQSQLFREAITDPLTGMYGRQALMFLLRREVESARRYSFPLCLMMVDVDDLERHNEVSGRKGGDEVLREVAKRLHKQMRGADIVVRYGGDEFLICMPQADLEKARVAAERVMESFTDNPVDAAGMPADVQLSIGVAELTAEDRDTLGLMSRAEHAVASAKSAGGQRIALISGSTLAVLLHDDEDEEEAQKAADEAAAASQLDDDDDDGGSAAAPDDDTDGDGDREGERDEASEA